LYVPRTIEWPKVRDIENEKLKLELCYEREEYDKKEKAILVGQKGVILQFKGSAEELKECIDKETVSYDETELLKQVQGALIISDTAGMGKSTILTRFSRLLKEEIPSKWILRFDLNDPSNKDPLSNFQGDGFELLKKTRQIRIFTRRKTMGKIHK